MYASLMNLINVKLKWKLNKLSFLKLKLNQTDSYLVIKAWTKTNIDLVVQRQTETNQTGFSFWIFKLNQN